MLYLQSLIEKAIDAWLSLVERCVRDAEVAGSNPVASIYRQREKAGIPYKIRFSGLFLCSEAQKMELKSLKKP